MINYVSPGLIGQAIIYTVIMFGCMTALSLFSKRRSQLYIGGVISSLSAALFWWSLSTWLFGVKSLQLSEVPYLMITLFIACMYIVYDTQVIIEKAELGDRDVPTHTLTFFIDLFDLFMKIVRLLQSLEESKKRKKNRDE